MVGIGQQVGRDAFQQGVFDGARRGAGAEAGAVADAENVGVDRQGWLAEGDVQDDVGGFAADAGQRLEGFAGTGHLAVVVLDELAGEFGDVFGLALPEAEGADDFADAGGAEGGHCGRGRRRGEQHGGDLVDADIGGLGGEHDGDQQGEGVLVMQFGLRHGVGLGQREHEGAHAGRRHARRSFRLGRFGRGLLGRRGFKSARFGFGFGGFARVGLCFGHTPSFAWVLETGKAS